MKKVKNFKFYNPLLLGLIVLCFAACGMLVHKSEVTDKDRMIVGLVHKLVANTHYNQLKINDEFSLNAFNSLLKNSDPNKRFLLKKDVERLKKHEILIDDYFIKSDLSLFDEYFPLVVEREEKVSKMVLDILEKPIRFNEVIDVQIDADSLDFCEDEKALKERWKQNLAFMINDRIFQLEKKQEADSSKVSKSFEDLEIEAREQILKRHQEWFKRLSQLEKDDRLSTYVNSILAVYGPHTNYYPPKDKEDFDIGFSGKLEGIGATLSMKEGYINVEKIVPGSASWKAGELKAGDVILEVAQGDEPPVDVYDMRLDKAVRLIRGPKGTEVRLTIKKVEGEVKVISIIRDVVIIEETYAKSVIISDTINNQRYGYINLESFYADFNNRNGRRCSKDVLEELRALKKDKVNGVILDLRNNGGGSLTDAIEMAGYFINAGPIVQVDGVGEAPEVYRDFNPLSQFDQPLIVMVNHYSASASEIFAAAIQDYKRGLIIGTNSFGKGTVQRFQGLKEVADAYKIDLQGAEIGDVKETIAKFFRINGGATQLKGVKPDVLLPDNYMFLDLGEGSYDFALPWKAIPAADYTEFNYDYDMKELAALSQQRIDTAHYFKQVINSAKMIKEGSDLTTFSSDYTAYKKTKQERDSIAKAIDQTKVIIKDWKIDYHTKDLNSFASDTIAKARMETFKNSIQGDMYIREGLRILNMMNKN